MDDHISHKAAIDAIDVLKRNYPSSCFEDLCKAVDIAIKALSAEPERKRGRWEHIYIKRRGYTYDDRTPRTRESAYCTACRAIVPELKKISRGDSKYRTICNVFNFCPNCGADMRGGEDETD